MRPRSCTSCISSNYPLAIALKEMFIEFLQQLCFWEGGMGLGGEGLMRLLWKPGGLGSCCR